MTLTLILAFTVIMSNVSMAGSTNNGVPNAGLFQFGPSAGLPSQAANHDSTQC